MLLNIGVAEERTVSPSVSAGPSTFNRPNPPTANERADDESPEATALDSEAAARIPLIEGMQLDGDMALLHEGLEREVDDLSWSDAMEVQLLLYFSSKPGLAENFSLPTVICRQTGCEVQAIGYGAGSLDNWEQQTSDMSTQPWAPQFTEIRMTASPLGADVSAIVVILLRAAPDSTLQSVELLSATS